MKARMLCCFDVDGTVVDGGGTSFSADLTYAQLMRMRPYPNIVRMVAQAIARDGTEVMFCTGRPKSMYGVTWRWLNRHLQLADAGKRTSLVCRPDETTLDAVPQYKLSELVQAIRRQPQKLAELRCYDDSIANLRLFQTLRPMVSKLRLYRCEDGVATLWTMGS